MSLSLGVDLANYRPIGSVVAPLTTPVLNASTTNSQLVGDFHPSYSINFVDAYPTGASFGDTLQGRWGTSEAAAIALAPVATTIDEAWVIDETNPFPALDTFSAAQPLGTTVHYQVRAVGAAARGNTPPRDSAWSNFRTLTLADGTMNAPALADLTGQTTSTRVWSASFSPTGMDVGAYARLKGTGPIERTRNAVVAVFEAGSECAVLPTDSVRIGADTPATGLTETTNVVTNRNVALVTFKVATAAGTAAGVVHANSQHFALAYGSASATISADYLGATRVICILHSDAGTRTISSVASTKAGAWTETVVTAGSTRMAIWTAPATTAGSENVTVTLNSAPNYITLMAVRAVNLGTAANSTAVRVYASSADPKLFGTALAVSASSKGLAFVFGASSTNVTVNNGALLHQLAAGADRVGLIEYNPGTVTPSFNTGLSNNAQGVAMAWPFI